MSFDDHDYRDLSMLTGVCSLESFWDYLDILYLYKIIYECVDSKYLFSLLNFNNQIRDLRTYRPFLLDTPKNNFIFKSFIYRSCDRVNTSNTIVSVLDHGIDKFKSELRNIILKFE